MKKININETLSDEDFDAIMKIAEYYDVPIKDIARFIFDMGIAWCYDYFGKQGMDIL